MYNIQIGRFADDPEAQGVVRPADDSWQLVIDKDGIPHLYVRCSLEDDGTGKPGAGMLCIEDCLPEEMSIRDLMGSTFGGNASESDAKDATADFAARRAHSPIPCPR